MSLHFQYLGAGLTSVKIIELLKRYVNQEHHEEIDEYGNKFDQLLEDEEYEKLIKITLDIIEKSVTDKTMIQPLYASVQYWITESDKKNQKQLINQFIKHLDCIPENHAVFKIKLIANLFNSLSPNFELFQQLLEQSKQLRLQNLIIPSIINNLQGFLQQWDAKNHYTILTSLLNAIMNDEEQICFIAEYILRNTVINQEQYIKAFVIFQNINKSFKKLQEIANQKEFQVTAKTQINQLVNEIIKGNIKETILLFEKEKTYFENLNLRQQQYIDMSRISKLLKLQKNKYSFKELNEELQIDQVELWFIQVIQTSNIEAKIDQHNQWIYINDNSNRYLNKEDWLLIQQKLKNLQNKLKVQQQ